MSGIRIDMELNKTRVFLQKLNKVALGVQSRSQQILLTVAEQIMEASKAQVPQDTKALLSSAYVAATTYRRSLLQVTFGYGGPKDTVNPRTGELASTYAIYVHERLDAYHPVGKAKFLEDPVNEYAQRLPQRLQAEFMSMFAGGVVRG